jgi:Zn-finger nucleic acid-binding protein
MLKMFCGDLAQHLGLESAIVLSQIKYWIKVSGRSILNQTGKWIYNSLEEWHKQFPYWSLSKLRRIIKSLEDSGLIISKKINSKKWNQTKWYTLDYDALDKLIGSKESKQNQVTNRFVQNEQMILKETKNNYTKESSYKEKKKVVSIKLEEDNAFCSVDPIISKNDKLIGKEDTANTMVEIWNSIFKNSADPIIPVISKASTYRLSRVLKTKFQNSLEEWNTYAKKVNSSQFLMGEKQTITGFKAQFLWLLKDEVIDTILQGGYGVGDRKLDSEMLEENLKKCKTEVNNLLQEKITQEIASKSELAEEKQEFKEYVLGKKYLHDGDQYNVHKHMEVIGKEYMFGGYITSSHIYYPGNEKYKERIFKSYLMKKYHNIDELGLKYSIDNVMNTYSKETGITTLRRVRDKLKFFVLPKGGETQQIRYFMDQTFDASIKTSLHIL